MRAKEKAMTTDRITAINAGFAMASLFAGWHLCWLALVALGAAQFIIDFVLWLHFIKPIYVVEPFELERAALLLVITTGLGFVLGWTFARIWNAGRIS
jgi:hypothetical protein